MRKFTSIVDKEDEGLPLRRMLKKHFDFSSRLFAKLRHQERVYLNDKVLKGYMHPKEGDLLTCVLPEEQSNFEPEDIPFGIVYNDDDMLIIDKPAGFSVHPTKGHPLHTMANAVTKYMEDTGDTFKIRFVNRLDMDTTGILVIGKNSHTQDSMVRDMNTDRIQKYYQAIVLGIIEEDELTIDLPIGMPDPEKVGRAVVTDGTGRPSVTHVKVLERYPGKVTSSDTGTYDGLTLIELRLETGRTHQIRVHMSHIGHPVLGDTLYGGTSELIPRQALHAYKLTFHHPATDELKTVSCELPEDMQKVLDKVRQ